MSVVLMKVAASLYPLGRNHCSKFLIVAASSLISSGVKTEMDFAQLRIHHVSFFFPTFPLCSDGSLSGKVPAQCADTVHREFVCTPTALFRFFFKTATAQSLSSHLWVFLQDTRELNLILTEQERTR